MWDTELYFYKLKSANVFSWIDLSQPIWKLCTLRNTFVIFKSRTILIKECIKLKGLKQLYYVTMSSGPFNNQCKGQCMCKWRNLSSTKNQCILPSTKTFMYTLKKWGRGSGMKIFLGAERQSPQPSFWTVLQSKVIWFLLACSKRSETASQASLKAAKGLSAEDPRLFRAVCFWGTLSFSLHSFLKVFELFS